MAKKNNCKVECLKKYLWGEKSDQNHLFDLEFLKNPTTDLFAFPDSVNVDNIVKSVTFFYILLLKGTVSTKNVVHSEERLR